MGIIVLVTLSPAVGSLRTGTGLLICVNGVAGQSGLHGAISVILAAAFTLKVPKGHMRCQDWHISPSGDRGSAWDQTQSPHTS